MGLNGGGSSLLKWGGYENREVLTPSGAGQVRATDCRKQRGRKKDYVLKLGRIIPLGARCFLHKYTIVRITVKGLEKLPEGRNMTLEGRRMAS